MSEVDCGTRPGWGRRILDARESLRAGREIQIEDLPE